MTGRQPILYSSGVEDLKEDEPATVDGLVEAFDTILEQTSTNYNHAVRSVHAKAHGVLHGHLEVDDGLPTELAQGLFSAPRSYEIFMRFSTNAGDLLPDDISLPRGLSIKVLGVSGERLPGADGNTQDFLLVNGPIFQVKTADKFLSSLKLLAKTTDRLEKTKEVASAILRSINSALGAIGLESATLNSLGGAQNVNPLGETYFSTTPFRYGDYIAKFSVAPLSDALKARTGQIIDASGDENAIRSAVRTDMSTANAIWEFRVQLCRDLEKQPIEDSTVLWNEEDAPFHRVGIIKAMPQDSWDQNLVQTVDEELRFSVWTGLSAHQPLGNINRARRIPYQHSAKFRARFNGCPIHEPRLRSSEQQSD